MSWTNPKPRHFPDLPCGEELIHDALLWAAEQRETYSTVDLERHLAKLHNLTVKQLAYRFPDSGLPAWPNYVAWATSRMTAPFAGTNASATGCTS